MRRLFSIICYPTFFFFPLYPVPFHLLLLHLISFSLYCRLKSSHFLSPFISIPPSSFTFLLLSPSLTHPSLPLPFPHSSPFFSFPPHINPLLPVLHSSSSASFTSLTLKLSLFLSYPLFSFHILSLVSLSCPILSFHILSLVSLS